MSISNKALRGTAIFSIAASAALLTPPASAGTVSVLHSFTGGADGATPYKNVTADSHGNLYGETFYGAADCPDSSLYADVGCGTVYKIDKAGVFTTLVTFAGSKNGADGDGNLTIVGDVIYGTAYDGGHKNQGLLFSVKTNGKQFKILHDFTGKDGGHPNTYPRFDASGNLFSEAPRGGPGYNGTDGTGFGVLYEIDTTGTFIPLHYFSGGADGGQPGRIFFDPDGNIFGSAGIGGGCTGSGVPAAGCGTLWEYVPSTGVFTVLYAFTGGVDGSVPLLGGLDSNGNLFGATPSGGTAGDGSLFELKKTASGYSYTTLWSFSGGSDGSQPDAAPLLGSGDKLIGTTVYGGTSGVGVLYSYQKGALTPLYTFVNDSNGAYPESTPLMVNGGKIVSTTAFGGMAPCDTSGGTLISSYGCGVLFSYAP